MKRTAKALLTIAAAVFLASASTIIGLNVTDAAAQAGASIGETRARAIVAAFSSGEAQTLERAAQANYTPAALARRTPEQRAQAVRTVFGALGALSVTNLSASGDNIVVNAHGARGGEAVFTFTIARALEQRIDTISVQTQGAPPPQRADNPYARYAFLIGDWDTVPPSGSMDEAIHQTLRWGPSNSYIWYSIQTRDRGQASEHLHQEGIMTFNAATNNLDFLFVHEPGSYGLEQGVVRVEADGSVVRETTAIGGDGVVTRFRQVFRQTGPNTAVTSLMRQNPDGSWTPNFAGSDNLVMTRRRT